jgi:hypothetical protein
MPYSLPDQFADASAWSRSMRALPGTDEPARL